MPPELREGLRGLCRSHGWDYGVFWRLDRRDPRLLVMESFYEEQIRASIGKAITQVHLVGEGAIGGAALSGKHQWIYSDTCWDGSSPTTPIQNVGTFEGIDERQHQFSAGIKTIVIIPLPSFGVVQFGSAQKNGESLEFIHHVQRLFHQLDTMSGHFLSGDSCSAVNICDPSAVLASRPASFKSIDSLHDLISEELLEDVQSTSTTATLWTNLFPLESHSEARSLFGSINPHSSAVPEAVTTEGTSGSFGNPFQNVPTIRSFSLSHITSQYGASGADPHVLLFPDNNKKFSYSSSNSFAANLIANNWAMEVDTLPMLDRRNFLGMASHPHSSVPHMNPLHLSCGETVTACNPCRSQDMIHGSGEVLLGPHHSSSLSPFQLDGLSTSSKLSSFASDLLDNFSTVPPDLAPAHSVLSKFKDNHPHPSETPPELVIKGLNEPTEDNLMSVQSEPISCSSPSSNLLAMPAVNSPLADGDQKKGSATVSTQPPFDNDLFEGMELDINPKELRKECWDDLVMPLGNGISSNLGTSVSDGIPDMDMCSIAVADKGLFSESSFEQLLEVVVGGSANLSSCTSSMPTNNYSVNSLDLEHRLSALARVDYPQVCRDRASLPELNLQKIMQESSKGSHSCVEKKTLKKSHVGSWIDDSCSMNTESAVTNQGKKPEETAKVARKRARPGESTRPRPKDRQQIQDRVKELREIVPNGSKCSIDSLLDRTIKHMLFLQSVTKYADKLKHTDEPKMIGDVSGVVLRDNSGTGSTGATWAYEVAGQTMVCPILVEDLNPPGLMLVEMLCEDRGFFLEIADIIRGFSLTILKGVMETRETKIWARFLVEANKDVTRMDIFLSLVQLSQQTSSMRSQEQENKAVGKGGSTPFSNHQQSPVSIPVGFTDRLQ
ncbi:transcription factor bHLH157-like isoform X1 [Iris pallida]|uniref:Transcription factor bHLH157-like isoform X1 n=1 Tax=Iris pallida TaxID=29817 RepID=A0AAX6F0T2_IRIPA|nr:transcription factor bHLH157-like isoform X1 [Iris pallida]